MTDGVVQSVFAHIENPSPEAKAVMERLAAAYAAATEADRVEVNKLIERAKAGRRDRREAHARNGRDPLRRAQPQQSRVVADQDRRVCRADHQW